MATVDTVIAVLHIAAGAGLLALGADLLDRRWLRSAGRFDSVLGTFLVGLGICILVLGLLEREIYLSYLTHFLLGALLSRRYYAVISRDQRRIRDALYPSLLVLPGACGLVGSFPVTALVQLVGVLPAVLAFIAGLGGLLFDAIRLLQGKHVYKRDVVTALSLLPLGYLYLGLLVSAVLPGGSA